VGREEKERISSHEKGEKGATARTRVKKGFSKSEPSIATMVGGNSSKESDQGCKGRRLGQKKKRQKT